MLIDHLTIVGVGLIGGSVGLAAKARGVARRVTGVGRDRAKLELAVKLGAVDGYFTSLADGVRDASLVVFCTPVEKIAGQMLDAAPHCRPGTLFTDAGSTKGNILDGVADRLPRHVRYVPAHPLAGSEKTGVEHARADLFTGRPTIIVDSGDLMDPSAVRTVRAFWEGLGSDVSYMLAIEHDEVLATTSHLPHAAASGLAGVTPADWLPFTAGGFRDSTRIAGGDPGLWAGIFLANRPAVLAAVDRFSDRMAEFRRALEAGDEAALVRWLAEAKQVRDALGS